MNNRDSLRTQLIDALTPYTTDKDEATYVFDKALMPVLEAAMAAGELLVHRATIPQQPVNLALVSWLEQSLPIMAQLLNERATVSKAQALRCLEQIHENGTLALREAKATNENGTPKEMPFTVTK